MEILKKEKAIIEYYENVINQHKFDMLQIIILYNMKCHQNYTKLNNEEKEKILKFLYTLYLKDETKTDLGVFSDYAMSNYTKVLNGEITRENIYNYLDF